MNVVIILTTTIDNLTFRLITHHAKGYINANKHKSQKIKKNGASNFKQAIYSFVCKKLNEKVTNYLK